MFAYDGADNVTSLTNKPPAATGDKSVFIQAQWNPTWNKLDWITRPRFTDDPTPVTTDFTYYASGAGRTGQLQKVQRPLVDNGLGTNARPTYTYDYSSTGSSLGQLISETDPTGVKTTHFYDALGNLTSTTLGAAAVTTYACATTSCPALNLTTAFTPDDYGNAQMTLNARGYAATDQYDPMRRKTGEQQRSGPLATSPVIAQSAWTYDKQGRATSEQHAKSFSGGVPTYVTTSTAYTPTGKAWRVTDPDGKLTATTYDGLDRVAQATDGSGRTTGFTYDAAGQKLTELRGIGSLDLATYATYTYTANADVATVADANANTTAYTYNGLNRLIRTRFPNPATGAPNNADDENLTYDAPGNVLTRQTRSDVTITMGYDALERMTSKAVPLWGTVPARSTTYKYDLAGKRLEASDTWGHDLTWAYADAVGRNTSSGVAGPQWSGTKTVSYQYDADSNRTQLHWPESYYVTYGYDELDRMKTATENNGGTSTLLATFGYDALSRRTGLTYGAAGATIAWTYSDAGDLQTLVHNVTPNADDVTFTGTFDDAHRLTSEAISNTLYKWTGSTVVTTGYTPDRLNRYGAVAGTGFTYDGNQNLTSDGTWAYGYDPENRLLGASKTGIAWSFAYDPLGRRVSKSQTVGGSAFGGYLNDGDDELGDYSSGGAVQRRYVPGPEIDRPIAVREGAALTFFQPDRRGSVVAMSDQSGNITEGPYSYDSYGTPSSTVGVRYKFTGRRYDQEVGLYYYRARYYSSILGRFLQTDPVGYSAGLLLYEYAGGNPITGADPQGDDPGDAFTSPRAAAIDAIQFINAKSIATSTEFAGRVYYSAGFYYATPPNMGGRTFSLASNIPAGTVLLGDYHTHGEYSKPVECCNPDTFSDKDRALGLTEYNAEQQNGYAGYQPAGTHYEMYLGTPSGDIKEYDPAKACTPDQITTIGKAPRGKTSAAPNSAPTSSPLAGTDLGGILVGSHVDATRIPCATPDGLCD